RPDEVIVIDGSEDTETQQALAGLKWPFEFHYELVGPDSRGLTRQRNTGVRRARGELIAFLDDDTIPAPDYFDQLIQCFERHPCSVGVGGYVTGAPWRRTGASRS